MHKYLDQEVNQTYLYNKEIKLFCINKSNKSVNIVRVGNTGQDSSFTYQYMIN